MNELLYAIHNAEEIYKAEYAGLSLSDAAGRLIGNESVFKQISFSGSNLTLDCTDTIFSGCDFSLSKLRGASLLRVRFENCRFTGADLTEGFFKNCTFTNCKADLLNCNASKLQAVVFDSCAFLQSYFEQCSLKTVKFRSCHLENSFFTGTPLKGIDLTSCQIDGLKLRREDLAGCKLTAAQAIGFLWMLGVTIV